MLKLSGWHLVIALGALVGCYFEPDHLIPLMIWAALVAGLWLAGEKLLGDKG